MKRKFSLIILSISVVAFAACTSVQTTPLPTVVQLAKETILPTEAPTFTPTKIPLSTPTNSATPMPPTPSATPIPGPALTTYLPKQSDLPNCEWIQYSDNGDSAGLWCNMKGNVGLTVDLYLNEKPADPSAVSLYSGFQAIDVPMIGEQVAAGVDQTGKEARLVYKRGNWLINVDLYNPRSKLKTEDLISYAKLVDGLIPNESALPGPIGFPAIEKAEALKKYFSKITMYIYNNDTRKEAVSNELINNSDLCLSIAPVKNSRDYWSVALFDVQKQKILKKIFYEMYPQESCGGLTPRYTQGQFKTGDKYELRIAVGDVWVTTMPFETK